VAERGYTLVPLSLYFKEGRAKVELGLGKGKKLHDKRDTLRERTAKREVERAFKERQR
jgi:SsrA-binding protein